MSAWLDGIEKSGIFKQLKQHSDHWMVVLLPVPLINIIKQALEKFLKSIEWKLYGPSLEIEWILINHNNCIFP